MLKQEINALTTKERIEAYAKQLLEKSHFEVLSKLKLVYQTDLDKNLPLLKVLLNDDNLLNFIKNDILHYIIINGEFLDIDYTSLNVEKHIQTKPVKALYKYGLLSKQVYGSSKIISHKLILTLLNKF